MWKVCDGFVSTLMGESEPTLFDFSPMGVLRPNLNLFCLRLDKVFDGFVLTLMGVLSAQTKYNHPYFISSFENCVSVQAVVFKD